MNGTMETIVVIGGGQAGAWAARTLRDRGHAGRIVLVGAEPHLPYERPPLSKAILLGEALPESARLLSMHDIDRLRIEWIGGVAARRIDRERRTVELDNDALVPYDKLILCTGGVARPLPHDGAGHVHLLRTLDDAARLASMLRPGMRLAVIGGGWIGLEVAASAVSKGASVTLVEAAARLCERSVTPAMSTILRDLHLRHGVDVRLGTSLDRLDWRDDGSATLHLGDGTAIAADAVVAGIGLVPNDGVARAAGLACDGGVIVDAACRTSDPRIFAAGDVAVAPNSWYGRPLRLESWQNAQEQGIAAAESALGLPVQYDPLPWFWSHQFDRHIQLVGVPGGYHSEVVRGDAAGGEGLLCYLRDGRMVAAIGINAARDLRFAQRLIQRGTPVDAEALGDPSVPMAKL
ncbi:NAD(P)/FAD-dependent oxidoreductase [Pseudoduganella lutea]|uniref:Pyridine nucleotide-disulfide oxidoreductase n=1 Tax=Pseudoduganella lutea TaxID=321985 RepID=A0A4P6KSW3_9BURK|nr:FAD-dependent oxidoreductase [Pseudoduganella lutea]QBE61797.1 pyridine nucleotide-disulfide oxidoreductase [Pseudoduganella lutea]